MRYKIKIDNDGKQNMKWLLHPKGLKFIYIDFYAIISNKVMFIDFSSTVNAGVKQNPMECRQKSESLTILNENNRSKKFSFYLEQT